MKNLLKNYFKLVLSCLFIATLVSCEKENFEKNDIPTIKSEEIKNTISAKALSGDYTFSTQEILDVAADLGFHISSADAEHLSHVLIFKKEDFHLGQQQFNSDLIRQQRSTDEWTVGSMIGAAIGTGLGAIIGSIAEPGGGTVIGSRIGASIGASLGTLLGAGIGALLHPGNTTEANQYQPKANESVTLIDCHQNYLLLENSSHWEDIYEWDFPRYGEIDIAGSIAPAGENEEIRVYFPKTDQTGLPKTKYSSYNEIYKFIFVIVKINNKYQMRIHSEDFYPDTINASDRINHSQLSEGGRYARLMGYPSMQVFGAGTIYVRYNQIVGLDSRTGHYYWSLRGQDNAMLDTVEGFLRCQGYHQDLLRDRELTDFIMGREFSPVH